MCLQHVVSATASGRVRDDVVPLDEEYTPVRALQPSDENTEMHNFTSKLASYGH